MIRSAMFSGILLTCLAGQPSLAATFHVFDDGSGDSLGQFEAPLAGGLLTAAAILYKGALFSLLEVGNMAPFYHADTKDISGVAAQLGAIYNAVAFVAPGFGPDPIECGIGECVFTFERAFSEAPGEWHIDKVSTMEAVDVGYYKILPTAVPLPASFGLLLAAGAVTGAIGRRRRT